MYSLCICFCAAERGNVALVYSVACLTFCGAVVSDVTGHVDGFAVDAEVPHAANKVSVSDREVLRQVGNATQQQWSC